MVQCSSPQARPRRRSLYAPLIATLVLATPLVAAEKGADRPVIPDANCALLDDPKIAGRMDGLLEFLAKYRGREAEFIGRVASGEGFAGEPNFEPAAADIAVSNPAQDTSGTAKTQSETSIALNATTGTLCSAYNDSFHGVTQGTATPASPVDRRRRDLVRPRRHRRWRASAIPALVWRKVDGNFYFATLTRRPGPVAIHRRLQDLHWVGDIHTAAATTRS